MHTVAAQLLVVAPIMPNRRPLRMSFAPLNQQLRPASFNITKTYRVLGGIRPTERVIWRSPCSQFEAPRQLQAPRITSRNRSGHLAIHRERPVLTGLLLQGLGSTGSLQTADRSIWVVRHLVASQTASAKSAIVGNRQAIVRSHHVDIKIHQPLT